MIKRLFNFNNVGQVAQLSLQVRTIPKVLNPFQNFCTTADKTTVENTTNKLNPFSREDSKPTENLDGEDAEERERRLKVLKLEADIANQEGRRVPELGFFQDHHWEHVLNLKSKSARSRYYAYLWQVEKKRESDKILKQERAEYGLRRKEEIKQQNEDNKHIIYGLSHTSLFLRIYDSTINHWQNNRLTRAMQFAPKIVLDCSYDAHMNFQEAKNAAKQLMLCFAENRAHDDPFDLHYCNVNMQSPCMQSLKRYIPTMLNPEFPMNVHEKCFTKLFPKENLVYLTPHCRTDLAVYNPDDVYIVGAMVDKVNNEPLSLAKAKKLGIRMARLPLDYYLQWGAGSGKSLTLNQMVNILLDLKTTGDWNKALKHVPRRKIIDEQLNLARDRNALRKRAVHLSRGADGIIVEKQYTSRPFNNPAVRSRKEHLKFDLDTWANSKEKIKQNSS